MNNILVLNCGSSSVKYQLIKMPSGTLLAKGLLERVGKEDGIVNHQRPGSDKYKNVEELICRMTAAKRPILLSIRRDRGREDKCKLCEGNQPNIDEISKKYGDRIELIEIYEDKPEGGALYNIIFHEDAPEKKLPLTAVISRGEILKFWAGKTVESAVYERYIKKAGQIDI